jgi:hypothetical protein
MKIRLVGAELFHSDGRKDRQKDGQIDRRTGITKLIIAFNKWKNTCIVNFKKVIFIVKIMSSSY